MNAVELSEVGKCYGGHWAVRGVDLHLAFGERLALLGHNGAGKTTLMKLSLGLIQPDEGTVRVFGVQPGSGAASLPASGFLPENVAFHDVMTGREILGFYARLKRRDRAECGRLLDRVGLAAAADRRVGTYSKGMRQRLGLAQALLGEPKLLLLDEPTSGLDPASRQDFYEIIDDLAGGGTAILLSSHMLTEVEGRTDRIQIMDRGRQVIVGTLDELRAAAGLPIEVKVRVSGGAQAGIAQALAALTPQLAGHDALTIRCGMADKMAVLRRVTACGTDILDVDVAQPGLDAIYARFTGATSDEEDAA